MCVDINVLLWQTVLNMCVDINDLMWKTVSIKKNICGDITWQAVLHLITNLNKNLLKQSICVQTLLKCLILLRFVGEKIFSHLNRFSLK